MTAFEDLNGQTITRIVIDSDEILFCVNGPNGEKTYRMYHQQDCCESVTLVDINGNLADLVGQTVVSATAEATSENAPPPNHYSDDSQTWTFYRIQTAQALVVMRWYGTSNGYYSEGVSFEETLPLQSVSAPPAHQPRVAHQKHRARAIRVVEDQPVAQQD